MDKIVFYPVVVLYNCSVVNSTTCCRLKHIQGHELSPIIVDNSTDSNTNEQLCQKIGWQYISMRGNAGLSRAYNKALDFLARNILIDDPFQIVIWFDDDTKVTQHYFDELKSKVKQNSECDIFAPVIRGQDGRYWSPNEAHFFKNRQLKEPGGYIPDNLFNAINSCTAVRFLVYKEYRYDEHLFLDQVDHLFFADQRSLHRRFCKLNVVLQHNFSLKSKMNSLEAVKHRYSIMIPDFLYVCSGSYAKRFLGFVKVAGWGIRESIRYQAPNFFFWCIKKVFSK